MSAPKASDPGTVAADAAAPSSEVKVGMGLADVKKILGAPDDARHEHGPGDSEIDIWIYKDTEVKFVNEKVTAVTKR